MMFLEQIVPTDRQHQFEMVQCFVLTWLYKILLELQQEVQPGLLFITVVAQDGDKLSMEDSVLF